MKTEKLILGWFIVTFILVYLVGTFTNVGTPETTKSLSVGLTIYWWVLCFFSVYIESSHNKDRTSNTAIGTLGLLFAYVWAIIQLVRFLISILTNDPAISPMWIVIIEITGRGSMLLLGINLILLYYKIRKPSVEPRIEGKPKNH